MANAPSTVAKGATNKFWQKHSIAPNKINPAVAMKGKQMPMSQGSMASMMKAGKC